MKRQTLRMLAALGVVVAIVVIFGPIWAVIDTRIHVTKFCSPRLFKSVYVIDGANNIKGQFRIANIGSVPGVVSNLQRYGVSGFAGTKYECGFFSWASGDSVKALNVRVRELFSSHFSGPFDQDSSGRSLSPIVRFDRVLNGVGFAKFDTSSLYHNVGAELPLRTLFGVFQSELGGRSAFPRLSPSQMRVVKSEADTSDAQDAQRELAERNVKSIVGRNGFPRIDLQSPLIAILGLLAMCAGYGIGAFSQRSNVSPRTPNTRCNSQNQKNKGRND